MMPEGTNNVCLHCGGPYERNRDHGKFCSPRCRKLAWAQRKAKHDLKPSLLLLLRDDEEVQQAVRQLLGE